MTTIGTRLVPEPAVTVANVPASAEIEPCDRYVELPSSLPLVTRTTTVLRHARVADPSAAIALVA